MKKRLSNTLGAVFVTATIMLFSVSPTFAVDSTPLPPKGDQSWNLVFNDEFEGSSLDTTKWSYNYPWGNTHNHRAYCVQENVSVSGGLLKIKGENKRHSSAPSGVTQGGEWYSLDYTSGAVNTKNKFSLTTGYIEGRFKVPGTKGFWPAFWTLNTTGEWPPEIDILEVLCHAPKELHTNYHYGPSWDNKWSHYQKFTTADLSKDFHTYAVEWTPEYMKWYLDGKQIGTSFQNTQWINQSKNMYVIINMAIGGWEDDPDSSTQWPSNFECDWVRVWQKSISTQTPVSSKTPSPMPTVKNVKLGDVNGDRNINSIDFGLLRMFLLGINNEFPDEDCLTNADVNKSGTVDSIDFALLRKFLLGFINEF